MFFICYHWVMMNDRLKGLPRTPHRSPYDLRGGDKADHGYFQKGATEGDHHQEIVNHEGTHETGCQESGHQIRRS